jgi:aspartyl protease family protein
MFSQSLETDRLRPVVRKLLMPPWCNQEGLRILPIMRQIILIAAVALILAGTVPRYFGTTNTTMSAVANEGSAGQPSSESRGGVTIQKGYNGHFQVEAVVDGRHIDFMVDTGATTVALRESDAARLGIHPTERDYSMRSATANGIVRVAPVSLDRVEVGDITVHNVAAVIIPDQALNQNLLGMSFLSRLRWQQDNGRLVLDQ